METGECILEQIAIVNRVLEGIGQTRLDANENFVLDTGSAGTHYLHYSFGKNMNNALPLEFYFQATGLRIDVDQIPEALEWPLARLRDETDSVVQFLSNLMSGFVLLRKADGKITMVIFSETGDAIESLVLRKLGVLGVWGVGIEQNHLFFPRQRE
ncbi:MAG: hypothetical protein R2682_05530 [Pyrinomonadaceae bacterium]